MCGCANTTYPAYKSPCIARVAAFQYGFDATYHGPGTKCIGNFSIIHFYFNPQMSFNPGDGVYYNSFGHGYFSLEVSVTDAVSGEFTISLCLRILVTMAWPAMPTAVAIPSPSPILSAVVSIPKPFTLGRC